MKMNLIISNAAEAAAAAIAANSNISKNNTSACTSTSTSTMTTTTKSEKIKATAKSKLACSYSSSSSSSTSTSLSISSIPSATLTTTYKLLTKKQQQQQQGSLSALSQLDSETSSSCCLVLNNRKQHEDQILGRRLLNVGSGIDDSGGGCNDDNDDDHDEGRRLTSISLGDDDDENDLNNNNNINKNNNDDDSNDDDDDDDDDFDVYDADVDEDDNEDSDFYDTSDLEYVKFSSYVNRNLTEKQARENFYADYMVGSEIGKGGFGTIFNGLRKRDNKPVAIKVIKKLKVTQWYEFNNNDDDDEYDHHHHHHRRQNSNNHHHHHRMGGIYEMEYDNNNNNTTTTTNSDVATVTVTSPSTSSDGSGQNINDTDVLYTKRIPLEIALMIKVRNVKNCIKILDYLEQKACFIIIMERYENSKDLFDYITDLALETSSATAGHNNNQALFVNTSSSLSSSSPSNTAATTTAGLCETVAREYFRQIVHVIVSIYKLGVLHRDIKDENILVDMDTHEVKLIDFGAGTFINPDASKQAKLSDFHGTRVYSPPEWILTQTYHGDRAAVWSLGVLLFNMIYGDIPFEEDEDIVNCRLYSKRNILKFGLLNRDVDDLIKACLNVNDAERIKIDDILKHKWLLPQQQQQ